jgi:CDGSH-type Zn-finger protein
MPKDNSVPLKKFLEVDDYYAWCPCGRSERTPFCDGSHKGSGFKPLIFQVEESKEYFLCKCGNTRKPPYCDGTHKRYQ